LVFETVPEKVAIAPSDADALLVELLAFYIYLERCHGAFAAHAVMVGPSHAPALRLALADTRRRRGPLSRRDGPLHGDVPTPRVFAFARMLSSCLASR
jgi:hypothetical protein